MSFEPFKDRGGIAVEKIEIGEIYGNVSAGIFVDLIGKALEQKGIVDEHIALDLKICPPSGLALRDLCRH